MANTITYRANGKVYHIPEEEKEGFLSEFPDAVESKAFVVGDKKYNIPLDDVEGFKSEFPDAALRFEDSDVKKKDETQPVSDVSEEPLEPSTEDTPQLESPLPSEEKPEKGPPIIDEPIEQTSLKRREKPKKTLMQRNQKEILDSVYEKYPGLSALGDVTLQPSMDFTREATGVGDIEYMSPEQDAVNYESGYTLSHPKPGTHGIIYNPTTNTEQGIALDMLHGMTEADGNYASHRREFGDAMLNKYGEDFERDWALKLKEEGEGDGKEAFKNNWIDGKIRNLLFEGSTEDFDKQDIGRALEGST
jgi:hypothetical protein